MKIIKYIWLLIFFTFSFLNVLGKVNKPDQGYLIFKAQGIDQHNIKMSMVGNICNVVTPVGFVSIYPTALLMDNINTKYYCKAYFNTDSISDTDEATQFKKNGSKVFLPPGTSFVITILEGKNDQIIYKYILQRPKLIPKIDFYESTNLDKSKFYTSNESLDAERVSISAGEKISIGVQTRSDFKNLEVEYTLLNEKNNSSVYEKIEQGLQDLTLEAGTNYQLRVSYTAQQELTKIISIEVKPYWYKSFLTYIVLLIIILFASLLVITLGLKYKLHRSKQKQHAMEQSAIRLQSLLNPHFTFNALNSIQGLINTNRIDDANYYLQEFSSLLRINLSKSQDLFHSLDQELEMIQIYIRIEALRFNFDWDLHVDESIQNSEIEVPPLIIQPLVENAIKHGFANISGKGKLILSCKRENGHTFVVTVQDNGTWIGGTTTYGYGLSLTKERIETVNKLNEIGKIDLNINTQNGTKVSLIFSNWMN